MVVEEQQQCCSSPSSLSTMELELNYEITRVANYILTHNFSRVAFQVKKNYSSSIFTHPYAQFLFTTQNPFPTLVNYLIYFDIFLTYLFCFLGGKFPDEQLKDATRVVREVREKVGKKEGVGLYVMADTTYGSCCVDEVGASHINADSVIHFGHTCLSP